MRLVAGVVACLVVVAFGIVMACDNGCPIRQSLVVSYLDADGAASTAAAELEAVAQDRQAAYEEWDNDYWLLQLEIEVAEHHSGLDPDYELADPWDTALPVCDYCYYLSLENDECLDGAMLAVMVRAAEWAESQSYDAYMYEVDRHDLASQIAAEADAAARAAFHELNQHLVECWR